MKKIVLLGDSIRQIGYGKRVAELLTAEGHEVWQPEDNCRYAKYTLCEIDNWKNQIKGADVVHWNNGLWDSCDRFHDGPFTELDEYVKNMVRIARILKTYAKTVIFATTTPVKPEISSNSTVVVDVMNRAVVPALQAEGVLINDLFGLVWPNLNKYIGNDLIHLSETGVEACAQQVAASVRAAL